MFRVAGLFIVLLLVWLCLSGMFKTLLVALGVVSAGLVVWFVHRMDVIDHEGHPLHLTLRAPFYWIWLMKEMVVSSISVAAKIVHPSLPIAPKLGEVPHRLTTDVYRAIYANSITLTPGTVCINIGENSATVHAFHAADLEALEAHHMADRVAELTREELAAQRGVS